MLAADWLIIAVYITGLIGMSLYLGRGQRDQDDYYVGGRGLPWWAVGLSTMATQTSAISFISIPAFVALKPGGGLTWLQYELSVPLAMIGVSILLLPFFRKLKLISVYEYLELRFGPSIRYLISAVFLISRALGTGVGLYASAIVLAVMLDQPLWVTILLMGAVTVVYDTIGGIKAVVYSDVLQTLVLLAGLLLCISVAVISVGGWGAIPDTVPATRWHAIDPSMGLGDGSSTPFWGFVVGGLFLYLSYYGVDQSQVQRELAAKSLDGTRKSLYMNGFLRFPLTLLYILLGLALGAVYVTQPELQDRLPAERMDFLVPIFIVHHLPWGIRGILVAALLAASMSSLDSALNSLSAVTMRDFIDKRHNLSATKSLRLSKLTTVAWGIIITGFAFFVGNISDTVIESINKIGSAFYGPVLAAFLVGILSSRANATGVFAGVLAGVGFNLTLWLGYPEVFWMWWNLSGLVIAVIVTFIAGCVTKPGDVANARSYTLVGSGFLSQERLWRRGHSWLLVYFFLILGFMLLLDDFASGMSAGL